MPAAVVLGAVVLGARLVGVAVVGWSARPVEAPAADGVRARRSAGRAVVVEVPVLGARLVEARTAN